MWFLQIAQLSTTISHDQRATAFHCFHNKIYLGQIQKHESLSIPITDLFHYKSRLVLISSSALSFGHAPGSLGSGLLVYVHRVGHVAWAFP